VFDRNDFSSYFQYVEISVSDFNDDYIENQYTQVNGIVSVLGESIIMFDGTSIDVLSIEAKEFQGEYIDKNYTDLINVDDTESILTYQTVEDKNPIEAYDANKIFFSKEDLGYFITDGDSNDQDISILNLVEKKISDIDLEEIYAVTSVDEFESKEVLFGDTSEITSIDDWFSGSAVLSKDYDIGRNLTQIQFTVYAKDNGGDSEKGITFDILGQNGQTLSTFGIKKLSKNDKTFRVSKLGTYKDYYGLVPKELVVIPLQSIQDIYSLRMNIDADDLDDIYIKNIIVTNRR
jgi:hypothetical protein